MRLTRMFSAVEATAHCDLPCGVYDPAQARIEAESVKAIQEKYQANEDPVFRTRAILIAEQRSELGPLSRGERNTLVAFGVAVTLWILPGAVGLVLGDDSALYDDLLERLDEGVVAIVAASLLFLLPVDWAQRKFTLSWNDAVQIDWGTIILFGSGIALGTLLSSTGLAKVMGDSLADALGSRACCRSRSSPSSSRCSSRRRRATRRASRSSSRS